MPIRHVRFPEECCQRLLQASRAQPLSVACMPPDRPLSFSLPDRSVREFVGRCRPLLAKLELAETEESNVMVYRPRTKLKLARKAKRCPKCNKLVGMRVRCKTCHKKLR